MGPPRRAALRRTAQRASTRAEKERAQAEAAALGAEAAALEAQGHALRARAERDEACVRIVELERQLESGRQLAEKEKAELAIRVDVCERMIEELRGRLRHGQAARDELEREKIVIGRRQAKLKVSERECGDAMLEAMRLRKDLESERSRALSTKADALTATRDLEARLAEQESKYEQLWRATHDSKYVGAHHDGSMIVPATDTRVDELRAGLQAELRSGLKEAAKEAAKGASGRMMAARYVFAAIAEGAPTPPLVSPGTPGSGHSSSIGGSIGASPLARRARSFDRPRRRRDDDAAMDAARNGHVETPLTVEVPAAGSRYETPARAG